MGEHKTIDHVPGQAPGQAVPEAPPSKPKASSVPTCFGCGRYHGSVGAEMHCLRRHLGAARERIVELQAKLPADGP